MIDKEKIGVKIEPIYDREEGSSRTDTSKIHKLRIWLFWKKGESYPFNFIGNGEKTISENLGISREEAKKLLVLKLEQLLPTIQNMTLRNAVEKRILRYTTSKDKTYECRRCKKPFKKTHNWQKNCKSCREWFKTYGKYGKKPQPQQGITNEEREVLKQLRDGAQ